MHCSIDVFSLYAHELHRITTNTYAQWSAFGCVLLFYCRANIMKIAIEGKDTQPPVESTTQSINVAASVVHKSWVIQLPHHSKVHEGSGFMDLVSPDS